MKKQIISDAAHKHCLWFTRHRTIEEISRIRGKPVLVAKDTSAIVSKPLVTFVELGSVNCIPCRMPCSP